MIPPESNSWVSSVLQCEYGAFATASRPGIDRALRRAGFGVVRIRGSHHFLQHPDGRKTVVPVHAGEIIGIGLLNKILADIDMTRLEFMKWV
jgi:predicted RNA binding protein YcfA (HicA-like mRNA interferase family)